ncbi:hypothetical protein FRB94_004262 [Tulasnella sp. JGI-2019a]|nr:hypothetical protein FRB93_000263 [Tulasnella sp. JGI-2019a]KAG9015143.1 hypothetical protein FRB94_004262 [Tulasnella sp. JGI-2019a]KAG9039212.1 hypothetical protein FRB95_011797 [Tulasnella sp. JGI-2019a]
MSASILDLAQVPHHIQPYVKQLQAYVSPTPEYSIASFPSKYATYPKPRLAAVLILLYHDTKDDSIRVTLTTRSMSLRSHPGQVALPGGKSDPDDKTPVFTALREAHEEIGLPTPHPSIHILTTLPAQISLYKIIVTPVVAYLSDPTTVLPQLKANPDEVDEIFDWRLDAFLDPSLVPRCRHETKDIPWVSDTQWREHIFQRPTTKSSSKLPAPIKGLTADILILAAQVAYAPLLTSYERWAPRQPHTTEVAIQWVMEEAKRVGGFKTTMKQDLGLPTALVMPRDDQTSSASRKPTSPLATTGAPTAIVLSEEILSPA